MPIAKAKKDLLTKWGITIDDKGKVIVDLSKIIGMTEAELVAAHKDAAEKDITIKRPTLDGLTVLDDTELETLKTNARKEGADEKERSVPEIIAQAYKDEYGIKLDTKDHKEVIKAIVAAKSAEAVAALNLTKDEQVALKEADIATLKKNYKELEEKFTAKDDEIARYKTEVETVKDNADFATFISGKVNPILRPNEIRQRLLEEEGTGFKKVNGAWKVVDAAGNIKKDKLTNELDAAKALADILTKRKEYAAPVAGAAAASGGSHAGGSSPSGGGEPNNDGKVLTMSAFKAMAQKEGWNSLKEQREYVAISRQEGFDANS